LFYLLEAKNGKEALDILKRQEVNLIITNVEARLQPKK
jgi:YesN/AraC family two-component response regulator